MPRDVLDCMTERQQEQFRRLAEKYPCADCAHRQEPKCRMGFLVESEEETGCLSRKHWWKPRRDI